MSSTATTEAIRKTVLVDFAPAEAFDLFTTRVSSWWPTETHSYAHDKVTDVVFEPRVGGLLYEVTDEGTAEWARITAWEPPHRLAMEWLIGEGLRHRDRGALLTGGAGIASGARASRVGTRPRCDPRVSGLQPRLGHRAGTVRRDGVEESLKPAQPLRPRHRCVGRRGRGKHEERRLAEAALLQPELRPLAEGAAVSLLADEADRARHELERDPLEPLGRAGEVGPAQVA